MQTTILNRKRTYVTTSDFSTPNVKFIVEKFMVEKFMVEKVGVEDWG